MGIQLPPPPKQNSSKPQWDQWFQNLWLYITSSVAARYKCTTGASVSSTQPINYDTSVFDTSSAVTTGSSWKFTAPISGTYLICVTNVISVAAANNVQLFKNGSLEVNLCTTNTTNSVSGSQIIKLAAGDFIDIRTDAGGSQTLASAANFNQISIERIGN